MSRIARSALIWPPGAAKLQLYALLLLILLLGSAVRFHRLGAQSLWYDEGVAWAHSLRTLPELIPLLQRNVHVPAYFTLLGWWQDLTGSTEFALRALSALFSVLSIALSYALGARLFHPFAGLTAAALVAFNSFNIFYAQEARMYAMLTAVGALSMWLFVALLQNPRSRRRWLRVAVLGLVNALGMYTHVAFALIWATQLALAAAWLVAGAVAGRQSRGDCGRRLVDIAAANLLTLVAFLPWLPVSLAQIPAQPNLAAALPPLETLRLLLGNVFYGVTFEHAPRDLSLVAVVSLALGLLPRAGRRAKANLLTPLIWVALSLGIYIALGLGARYVRFLLPAQIGAALWLGRGAWQLWALRIGDNARLLRRLPRLALIIALSATLLTQFAGLEALYHHPDFQRDDMRGLARRIDDDLRAGDALIVSAAGLQELLRYYYQGDAPVFPLPLSPDDAVTRSQVGEFLGEHERLHVIFYGAAEQDPELVVEATLNMQGFEISDSWVDELRYVTYLGARSLPAATLIGLDFGDQIRLDSFAMPASPVAAGDALPLQLVWSASATPGQRYKVFVQLLDAEGALVAQRDSEPAGGFAPTTTWAPGVPVVDNHGLLIPRELPAGEYRLIAGLYDIGDPSARLSVAGGSYVDLGQIAVR